MRQPNRNITPLIDIQSRYRPTRILRPIEVELMIETMKPKAETLFKTALVTGARYTELRALHKIDWNANDNFILIDEKKVHRPVKRRYIRLPSRARDILRNFYQNGYKFPSHQVWEENLKRWAIKAGLAPDHLGTRTTRKTWESWLVNCYPNNLEMIALSQGHTSTTMLEHYLNIPFSRTDIEDMKAWVGGWL